MRADIKFSGGGITIAWDEWVVKIDKNGHVRASDYHARPPVGYGEVGRMDSIELGYFEW